MTSIRMVILALKVIYITFTMAIYLLQKVSGVTSSPNESIILRVLLKPVCICPHLITITTPVHY